MISLWRYEFPSIEVIVVMHHDPILRLRLKLVYVCIVQCDICHLKLYILYEPNFL